MQKRKSHQEEEQEEEEEEEEEETSVEDGEQMEEEEEESDDDRCTTGLSTFSKTSRAFLSNFVEGSAPTIKKDKMSVLESQLAKIMTSLEILMHKLDGIEVKLQYKQAQQLWHDKSVRSVSLQQSVVYLSITGTSSDH